LRARAVLRYALEALTERKVHAVLVIAGIVIGPAAIVSLFGATQGYSNASGQQFSTLGASTLFVNPSPFLTGATLTASDAAAIQKLQGVVAVAPYQQLNGVLNYTWARGGSSAMSVSIIAIDFSGLEKAFPDLSLVQGRYPSSSDVSSAAVGYSIANQGEGNPNNLTLNSVVTITGLTNGKVQLSKPGAGDVTSGSTTRSFTVTGIFGLYGRGAGISPDRTVFIPLASGEAIFNSSAYTGIMVVTSGLDSVASVESAIQKSYGQLIDVTSVNSLVSTIKSISAGTETLLEVIATTSVLVAIVAISTTMLTSVRARTREIGLLKALGSTNAGILSIFLSETIVVGLLGGVVGAAVGYALSFVVIGALSGTLRWPGFAAQSNVGIATAPGTSTLSITPAISPELVFLAVLLAVAIGVLGGLFPAWKASRMNPADALRRS
jgi:putative ABC transport system permease protein